MNSIGGLQFDRLRRVLGERRVVPTCPTGREADVAADDDLEPTGEERDDSSSWSAWITYVDGKGQKSGRVISCKRLEGIGLPSRVVAFCHHRSRPRSFVIDRIQELIDVETGEALDPLHHFHRLHAHGLMDLTDRALDEVARVLVYMARCDGHRHWMEDQELERAIERYFWTFGGSDADLARSVTRLPSVAPDADDVIRSLQYLSRCREKREIAKLILRAGGDVAAADGEMVAEEIRWAVELSDHLKVVASAKA